MECFTWNIISVRQIDKQERKKSRIVQFFAMFSNYFQGFQPSDCAPLVRHEMMLPYFQWNPSSFYYLPNIEQQFYMPCPPFDMTPRQYYLEEKQAETTQNERKKGVELISKIESQQYSKTIDFSVNKESLSPIVKTERVQEAINCSEEIINDSKKKKPKRPETKNLVKNYGRSIISFILRHKDLRLKVLKREGIPDEQFVLVCRQFREHIHTISAIRYLWQSHSFAKAFRILSCHYLRKYNLHHVFNSKIEKYDIYLKYQTKIMRSLESPSNFESLKDF